MLQLLLQHCSGGTESFTAKSQGRSQDNRSSTALCVLAKEPHPEWVEFLHGDLATTFDVYFMVDNNDYDLENDRKRYPQINFLQIPDDVCHELGYVHVNSVSIEKTPIAWDKALYYFAAHPTGKEYRHVWFVEDDVFLPTANSITDLDAKYPDEDLICNASSINETGSLDGWNWWHEAKKHFELPWSGGLMCVCRLSRPLLQSIDDYATQHIRLVFIELFFATLAQRNHLVVVNPEEFANVVW